MPKMAKNITIDRNGGGGSKPALLVDGVEFPWYIEDGLSVDDVQPSSAVMTVRLSLLVEDVTIVPRSQKVANDA